MALNRAGRFCVQITVGLGVRSDVLLLLHIQASSFFNKNLTNADNDNSMNISTKMEMSLVNKPANNMSTTSKYTYIHQEADIHLSLHIHLVGIHK